MIYQIHSSFELDKCQGHKDLPVMGEGDDTGVEGLDP